MIKKTHVWISIGLRGINCTNFDRLKDYPISGIRINTGRISLEWSKNAIKELVEQGFPLSQIYLDIGNQKSRVSFKLNEKTTFKKNQIVDIFLKKQLDADFWIDSETLFEAIQINDVVYFSDGEYQGVVTDKSQDSFSIQFTTECILAPNVAIGIVGKDFSHFHLDDIENINALLNEFPINLIISFVESYKDVICARNTFPNAISIVPKIETSKAVQNIEEIVSNSSIVFIGRGDLGLAVGIEKIAVIQKYIIHMAKKYGCQIAVGTGILESLRYNNNPYRAEVIDVANLCYENVDAIVMTSETANNIDPFRVLNFLFKEIQYISDNCYSE